MPIYVTKNATVTLWQRTWLRVPLSALLHQGRLHPSQSTAVRLDRLTGTGLRQAIGGMVLTEAMAGRRVCYVLEPLLGFGLSALTPPPLQICDAIPPPHSHPFLPLWRCYCRVIHCALLKCFKKQTSQRENSS